MRRRHSIYTTAYTAHFVTTVTLVRGNWFLIPAECGRMLQRFEDCRQRYDLECFGYVLMPDHIHAVLRPIQDGPVISKFMQAFKRETSAYFRPRTYRGASLWQPCYDDVLMPGGHAVMRRVRYMHANPLRRGMVEDAEQYVWSSARDYGGLGYGIVQVVHAVTGEVLRPTVVDA